MTNQYSTVPDHMTILEQIKAKAQTDSHPRPHPLDTVQSTEWGIDFASSDPFLRSIERLHEFAESAPNDVSRAYVLGIIYSREMIRAVTGVSI